MKYNYKKWTKEEEYDIFKKYNTTKDEKTKNLIFNKNIFFVKRIVSIYTPTPQDYGDYFSEGCIGLLEAIDKFDYTQGTKFNTYSVWWINSKIMDYICQRSRNIRIPFNVINLIRNQNKKMFKKTLSDVYADLNLDSVFLDKETNDKFGNKSSISSLISDDKYYKPDEFYINNYLHDLIRKNLSELTEKEQRLMKMCYGIDCEQVLHTDISEILSISVQEVRRVRDTCLIKIRKRHSKKSINKIKEYLYYVTTEKEKNNAFSY